jgi:putative transposase
LYYDHVKGRKDWELKQRIEEVLRLNPSYGHRRIAIHLKVNKKRILRVMRLYGMKPYRRRGRKWRKSKAKRTYPNLLLVITPSYENHIWASDFTELLFHGRRVYVSTVIDLFTRRIVGINVAVRKGAQLTIQTLSSALLHSPRPRIFHSDNGREYEAKAFISILEEFGIQVSRSRPGCPWENGYQESFYSQFKVELGDPNRWKTLGELVYAIYSQIHYYNTKRIHTILKLPPATYAQGHQRSETLLEKVS